VNVVRSSRGVRNPSRTWTARANVFSRNMALPHRDSCQHSLEVVEKSRLLGASLVLQLYAEYEQSVGAAHWPGFIWGSTRATASIVRATSASFVRQLTTLIRIARRPRHVVPLKNAAPSALMAWITASV
jgi:hypothetical protein